VLTYAVIDRPKNRPRVSRTWRPGSGGLSATITLPDTAGTHVHPATRIFFVRELDYPDTVNLREHESRDDMKVWLSNDEVDQLLNRVGDRPNQRIAFALAARCGLRSEEITDVEPRDVRESDAGPMLIVWAGKGDKYRETPIPPELKNTIETANQYRGQPPDDPIVTSQSDSRGVSTRTLRRWMEDAREDLAETDDERWRHLTMHDLRRTWATHLKSADVDAMMVCDFGGWEDLETFLEAYRGDFTPEAIHREREKVPWL